MPPRVDQLLAVFDQTDAQGVMALRIRSSLRQAGYKSEIFSQHPQDEPGKSLNLLPPYSPQDLLIYHYSIGSPAAKTFLSWGGKKVMIYHNITPARFFRGFDDMAMLECRKGRRELTRFIPVVSQAVAVSEFNATELRQAGFPRVEVLPFPLVEETLSGPEDQKIISRYRKTKGPNILFVGRLAPNKRQDEIISIFQIFRDRFAPEANLFLIGSDNLKPYLNLLREKITQGGSRGIHLTGKISWAKMRAYYRIADLFLVLSEHEGFCVPLIEAIRARVPILAYAGGAIPETLGAAGLIVEDKNPYLLAGLIQLLTQNDDLRQKILRFQDKRLQQLRSFPFDQRLLQLVKTLLS